MVMDEGKDLILPIRVNQTRVIPKRMVKLFVLFLVLCIAFSLVSLYTIKHSEIHSIVASRFPKLRPCYEDENNLDHWINPPGNLMHSMSDKELFWRASLVPRIEEYPFNRTLKIAFMFLTKGPLPLSPLWERYFDGHDGFFSVYIHSLPTYHDDFVSSSVFYKRQIPSQVAEWGEMTMVDAERRLIANALLDISNEYFVLLSESCIPLYNFTTTYTYFKESKHSFMGSFDDPSGVGRGRYNPNLAPTVELSQWRKGSQWFELNRKLAVYIVDDSYYYPKFSAFCRQPCYVDEHYFPTMLSIRAAADLANRSVTWVDWSRGGPHPATYGQADINEDFLTRLLEGQKCDYNNQPSSICNLFARKFAPSALEPLLLLAPKFFRF